VEHKRRVQTNQEKVFYKEDKMNNKIDINKLPKIHIDTAHGAFNKYAMFFAFSSGQSTYAFSTSPLQMKLFIKLFSDNMEVYEKQFGKIDMSELDIISPIQPRDIRDGKR